MKGFFILFTIFLTAITLFSSQAHAKRFGGGSSFGKQRTMSAPVQKTPTAAPAPTAAPQQPATAPQSNRSKWLGPLAGLAIGAGLGALFASMGLGEGMGSILMIILAGVAIFMLISLFRRKQQPAMQYAAAGGASYGEPVSAPAAAASGSASVQSPANIPADFPVDSFLRSAKTSFIRLQAANDAKDLNDIREYTTPEMYAEISMQMKERDDTPQRTEVITLVANLLEVNTEADFAIASVQMSGEIRENNGPAEQFNEIWHVQKNLKDDKSVWLLAGIQQV